MIQFNSLKNTFTTIVLYLSFGSIIQAQDIIENEYFSIKIPTKVKLIEAKSGIRSYAFEQFTFQYSEMNSLESSGRFLGNMGKHIFEKKHWYSSTNMNGYNIDFLLGESYPEGHTFNNEIVAIDNSLYNTIHKNQNKIFSFTFSYPKQDSISFIGIIDEIKNSFQPKYKQFKLNTQSNNHLIILDALVLAFGYGNYSGVNIQSPFIQNLNFSSKTTSIEQAVKEQKSSLKNLGYKNLTTTETVINGNKTIILQGNEKGSEKRKCNWKTVYLYENANLVWIANHTFYHKECDKLLPQKNINSILESVRFK